MPQSDLTWKQKAGLDGNAYLPYLGQSTADNLFVQDFVQLGALGAEGQ